MELQIKYNSHLRQSCDAAFIRGSQAADWLHAMNSWHVPVGNLVCYVVAERHNPGKTVGCLVLLEKGSLPQLDHYSSAYTCLSAKLYIPVEAELYPALSNQELASLLLWDCQLFHPHVGFIGFEASDGILVRELLAFHPAQNITWNHAQPGPAPLAFLRSLRVQQPTIEEIMEQGKGDVSSKELTAIKRKDTRHPLIKWFDPLTVGLLSAGLAALKGLAGQGKPVGHSSDPSMLDKLENWMRTRLDELQKKRDVELKRLLDLFDKDADEALRYAIPLDSPYLNRGKSTPSSLLSRRSIDFNLGSLGGGRSADVWHADNFYESLRSKYNRSAEQAIASGNYRKAAYIYAELLGDFNRAAQVLRQGKNYREAAVLYQQHLFNKEAAAECLEQGGLYEESIELYNELGRYEKSGDLHLELKQRDKADACYEKVISQAEENKDFLEMARVSKDKLGDHERAASALFSGWQDDKKPEDCLSGYFDLAAEKNQSGLPELVLSIYEEATPVQRKVNLLRVLLRLGKKYRQPALEETSRTIAYEVLSRQASEGLTSHLPLLKLFVPDDQLLANDVTRFINTYRSASSPASVESFAPIRLMPDIAWYKGFHWRSQLLVLGISGTGHHLARANATGYVEYETWYATQQGGGNQLNLLFHQDSRQLLVYSTSETLAGKLLLANQHFSDELSLFQPSWLPGQLIGLTVVRQEIIALHRVPNRTRLDWYNTSGSLLRSVEVTEPIEQDNDHGQSELLRIQNGFVLRQPYNLLYISDAGKVSKVAIDKPLVMMAGDPLQGQLVVRSRSGCMLLTINDDNLMLFPEEFVSAMWVADMKFMGDKLLLVGTGKVEIYTINKGSALLHHTIKYDGASLVSVMAADRRDRIALLDEKGVISFHSLHKDS